MLGFNVFAADTDEDAIYLASSMQQAFINLRSGNPMRLQSPVDGYQQQLTAHERAILSSTLACSAIGNIDKVQKELNDFITLTKADELMITSQIFDHKARLHSYEITSAAWHKLNR